MNERNHLILPTSNIKACYTMKKIILLFLFVAGFLNSRNKNHNLESKPISVEENSKFISTEISFIEIGKGTLYGGGKEGVLKTGMTISNANDWRSLLSKMNSINNVSNNFTEADIDFNKFTLVVVALDFKSNGWEVEIDKIIENKGNISVSILKNRYETTVMTQPFHIVKIPKTDKKVVSEIESTEIIYINLSMSNSETYEFNLGLSSQEKAFVKKRPMNFEINKIVGKKFDSIYKYKPSEGYVGTDFVEIYVKKMQATGEYSKPSLLKITFDIRSDDFTLD